MVNELTEKQKKGALWDNENILYIDLASGYVIGWICQSHQTAH